MKYINYTTKSGQRSSITLTPVQLTIMKKLCFLHGFKGPNQYIRMVHSKGIKGNLSMAVRDWMFVELSKLLEDYSNENNQPNSRLQ